MSLRVKKTHNKAREKTDIEERDDGRLHYKPLLGDYILKYRISGI